MDPRWKKRGREIYRHLMAAEPSVEMAECLVVAVMIREIIAMPLEARGPAIDAATAGYLAEHHDARDGAGDDAVWAVLASHRRTFEKPD